VTGLSIETNPVRARVFSWQSTCRPDWVHEIKHNGYRLIVRRDVHAPRACLPLSDVAAETATFT
jgi:hypothetical protein